MRRVFAQIFQKSYVTKSPTSEVSSIPTVPKGFESLAKPSKQGSGIAGSGSASVPPKRSISISSSGPPGISPTPTSPPLNVGFSFPSLISQLPHKTSPKEVPRVEELEDVPLPTSIIEKTRRSQYIFLLDAAVNLILPRHASPNERTEFIKELNVKRVLSKNEEMKKVIFKVAATALTQNQEVGNLQQLHPFITTAGEVFFGEHLDEIQNPEAPQDLLTPGLSVLLLNALFTREHYSYENESNSLSSSVPKRHLLLAKALVETAAGYLLHRTIQETNHLLEGNIENSRQFERLHQGNKLATLTGDLLVVSLIKNVACTGNNKVLELVMNSLSEFSTTEIAKAKPFVATSTSSTDPILYHAQLSKVLAESIVFSKGFQSSILLSHNDYDPDPALLEWAGQLGSLVGLLWKTNFDWMKLSSRKCQIENIQELNDYLTGLKLAVDSLMCEKFVPTNNQEAISVMRQLVYFWGSPKSN